MPRNTKASAKIAPMKSAVSTTPIPPQYPQQTMGSIIKEGVGFGMGSAIGHRVIGAFFPTHTAIAPAPTTASHKNPDACTTERAVFETCLLNESEFFCGSQQASLSACLKKNTSLAETN